MPKYSGGNYKSAWFMAHRIREAMKADGNEPMGGEGKTVEADETFIGRKAGRAKKAGGYGHKNAVLSLVERREVGEIVAKNIKRETTLMTDEGRHYETIGKTFAAHETVEHTRDEYVRDAAHTNTIEGYFSVFKRGMKGVYQHCDERHLHRCLAEFEFRYSNRAKLGVSDRERADKALTGIVGKRLTYRRINEGKAPTA